MAKDDSINKSHATGIDIVAGMPPFPGEHPKAHIVAEWLEKFHDRAGKLKLQAVMDGHQPLRVQRPVRRNRVRRVQW